MSQNEPNLPPVGYATPDQKPRRRTFADNDKTLLALYDDNNAAARDAHMSLKDIIDNTLSQVSSPNTFLSPLSENNAEVSLLINSQHFQVNTQTDELELVNVNQEQALFRGNWDASSNTAPAADASDAPNNPGVAYKQQEWLYISVAGTINGTAVNIGDRLRWLVDNPPDNTATNLAVEIIGATSLVAGTAIDATALAAGTISVDVSTFLHAGTAEIDADRLSITWTPDDPANQYTPTPTGTGGNATAVQHITAHFRGIANRFATAFGNITRGTLLPAQDTRDVDLGGNTLIFSNVSDLVVGTGASTITTPVLDLKTPTANASGSISISGKNNIGKITVTTEADFQGTYVLRLWDGTPVAVAPTVMDSAGLLHHAENTVDNLETDPQLPPRYKIRTTSGGGIKYTLTRLTSTTATFPSDIKTEERMLIRQACIVGGKAFFETQVWEANADVTGVSNETHWDLVADTGYKRIAAPTAINPLLESGSVVASKRVPQLGDWALVYFNSYSGGEPVANYADGSNGDRAAYFPARYVNSNTVELLPNGIDIYHTGNVLGDQSSQHGLGSSTAKNNYFLADNGELDDANPGTINQIPLRVTGSDCVRFPAYDR